MMVKMEVFRLLSCITLYKLSGHQQTVDALEHYKVTHCLTVSTCLPALHFWEMFIPLKQCEGKHMHNIRPWWLWGLDPDSCGV